MGKTLEYYILQYYSKLPADLRPNFHRLQDVALYHNFTQLNSTWHVWCMIFAITGWRMMKLADLAT